MGLSWVVVLLLVSEYFYKIFGRNFQIAV